MTPFAYALLMAATSIGSGLDGVEVAQLTIRQRIIIRVPAQMPSLRRSAPIEWRERKGPRCIPMGDLAGAAITGPDQVDFILRGARMRAELESACPALDYYEGFYVSPSADGRICADRDMIRTRAGGQCGVARFRSLAPRR